MENESKPISVRMPDDLLERIKKLASDAGSNRSETIIELIEDGLESRKYTALDEISDDLKDVKSSLKEVKDTLDSYNPVMLRFRKYLKPLPQGGDMALKHVAFFVVVLFMLLLLLGILKLLIA